jgi:UPF0716 protein FxsA
MVKWVVLAILLLPLVEIGVFVMVAAWIGLASALGLTIATSLAGFLILSRGGRRGLARVRATVAEGGPGRTEALTGGALTVLAGVLLLVPGFLTDLVGLLLLVPPLRRRFAALVRRAVHVHSGRKDEVIDLSPAEWRQVPNPDLEHRPDRDGAQGRPRPRNRDERDKGR